MFAAATETTPLLMSTVTMVIEWLTFHVPSDRRERFIQLDHEVWTASLKTYPGFISKETWISPESEETLIFVIRWQTRAAWKAIPEADLMAIQARFDAIVDFPYTMTTTQEFQVRRFAVTPESAS